MRLTFNYCPQKVALIYNYQLLLPSESGPQCARPLTVLRKWASLFAALICIVNYCPQKVGLNVCGP